MDYCLDADVAEDCNTCIKESMEPSVQDSTCLHGASTQEQMANTSQACTMEDQSSV